tara:strand:+ start:612 stop:845 length:234 start_codon:yes stop_codon:yes gene_type:complete
MNKTDFRKAYEETHDLLNNSLEILDKLYDEKHFETRRDLLSDLVKTMGLVKKHCNTLAAGEAWTHAIEEKEKEFKNA